MLALGVDPNAIQALVRHAEIDMTMYYAHAQDATKQDAIQRYSEAFSHRGVVCTVMCSNSSNQG